MSTGLVTYFYSTGLQYDFIKIFPGMLAMTFATTLNSYFIEMKDKQQFLEKRQIEVLQRDLKKVLQVLPEGVMIYKRFGNHPHIKLWNNELERLFKFRQLKNASPVNIIESSDDNKREVNVDDLESSHLKNILTEKILIPIANL